MAKITVKPDCGNAPKKEILRDFEIAFTGNSSSAILDLLADEIYWPVVGDKIIKNKKEAEMALKEMLDGGISEMTIDSIITHGDEGAVKGTMKFNNGSFFKFGDFFKFTSHASDAKIKEIESFVIEEKTS